MPGSCAARQHATEVERQEACRLGLSEDLGPFAALPDLSFVDLLHGVAIRRELFGDGTGGGGHVDRDEGGEVGGLVDQR